MYYLFIRYLLLVLKVELIQLQIFYELNLIRED